MSHCSFIVSNPFALITHSLFLFRFLGNHILASLVDESLIGIVPQPVLSVWSIAYLPITGDLVTGSSDGLVRVYTRRPREPNADEAGEVSEEALKDHQEACEKIQQARNGCVFPEREQKGLCVKT